MRCLALHLKVAQSPPPLSPPLSPLPESPEPKLKPELPLDPADGMLAMMRPARRRTAALEPYGARPAKLREEHALAAEDHRLHAAGATRSKSTPGVIGGDAAGVDVQLLALRSSRSITRAAHLDEHQPSPSSFCMMKPSPPNRPVIDLALEKDADRHALRRGQERVLLADQHAAVIGELIGRIVPG